MIEALVVIAVGIAGLAFVAIPLRRGPQRVPLDGHERDLEDAQERKAAALAGIIDLEQERDAGKLSDEDFAILRRDYERDAISALRELDTVTDTESDTLEREIAAARAQLACPSCGAPRAVGSPCPRCGS